MRTRRVIGLITVVVLALGSGAAAQSADPSAPAGADPSALAAGFAAVSGMDTCEIVEITHFEEHGAGVALRCTGGTDDPRVSGPATMSIDFEAWDPDGHWSIAWTEHRIEGPEGDWAGRGYGIYDGDDVLHAVAMLVGSGAYQGLTYAYRATIPSAGDVLPVTIEGLIQPSAPAPGFPLTAPSSPPPAELPTIGQPADDGARVVAVETVDARTRDLTVDSPAVGTVTVRLLLPTDFETHPEMRWPVLYLLHGAGGNHGEWTGNSDLEGLTAAAEVLVVMPDGNTGGVPGWYTDWYHDGAGGPPAWETFHLVELRQLLERNWQAGDARAVAGLSMGGYGAIVYAARHPGLFRAAASYSGVLDLKVDPADFSAPADIDRWGDPSGSFWAEHDPIALVPRLAGTDLYLAWGDGQPGPLDTADATADAGEAWIDRGSQRFLAALEAAGVPATVNAYGPGTHAWPYWDRELAASLPMLLQAIGLAQAAPTAAP